MRRVPRHIPLAAIALLLAAGPVAGADATWPREIVTESGTLTIYQPQPEKLDGNTLKARAAASFGAKGSGKDPTFGVFWFTGHVDTDRDAGTSMVRDIVVTDVRWPESQEGEQKGVAEFLTGLMPKTGIPISLERLKASLATAESEQKSLAELKHDPPKIVVVEELSELLLYDGEPRTLPIPDSGLEQVANCAFAVVKDKRTGDFYLSGGKVWYGAKDPKGPWAPIDAPPEEVAKRVPPDTSAAPAPSKPPKIVVATEPTELIALDGKPSWQPLGKGELMYIANTETPMAREVASGNVFVLISGRWYRAATLAGPWTVVRPDELPAAFKDIPPASALGAVRVSVAGTPEAEDAMLDAQVPQTAAIERDQAKLEVRYDGEPQFKAIAGMGIEYAVNTSTQVLRIDGKYYACDEAVWFVSAHASGPWAVADSVPTQQIQKIPPSEPVYNVTYVTVYESTPEVVYVGYTPGYMWSYPWYGCPVYGTGWYYPPYWGAVYYPRPVTYGVHVSYNPYTGWGMGFSYSTGFLTVGVHFGGGYGGYYRPGYPPGYYRPPGYYPPGGYRPPYYAPGHRPGTPRPPYAGGARPGTKPGAGAARPSTMPAGNNLYQQSGNRDRVAPSTKQRDAGLQKADRVAKGPNNVYAGSNGQVYRQNQQGWQSRDQGQWKSTAPTPANRPAQPSPSSRPSQPPSPANRPSQPSAASRPSYSAPQNLNRDYQARQNGANRSAQPRPSTGSSAAAPRAGGGGRRR